MSLRKAVSISPSFLLRSLGLAALLFLVWAVRVQPLHAATYCFSSEPVVYTYYSNASETTVVGRCYEGNLCYTSYCTGTTSNYETAATGVPCEVCREE
jgi:hypothetical protein